MSTQRDLAIDNTVLSTSASDCCQSNDGSSRRLTQLHSAMRFLLLSLTAFFFLYTSAPAQGPAGTPAAAPASAAPIESTESKILKAQLDDLRKYQDNILTTVWGALGAIATVATLLVGFGWFANVRMYDRDKAALEQVLRATLLDELRKLRDEFSTEANQNSQSLARKINDGIVRSESQLKKVAAEATTKINEKLDKEISLLKSKIREVKDECLNLSFEKQKDERNKWIEKNVYRNALSSSIKALSIGSESGDEFLVGEALDMVSTDIQVVISNSYKIDNY